jgi:asparagine synthase (glutamine-hydrolysing)
MCGLAGNIGGTVDAVGGMLDRIRHRGPDGDGIVTTDGCIHGHVRLSLVDLSSAAAQPFSRGGSVLSFNGEIWNWRELRAEIEADGGHFVAQSDTEVLAAVLERDGLDGLGRLDGMFAFAWSSAGGEHWLVRDSFGKVPLYVAKTTTGFVWASERKAFRGGSVPLSLAPGSAFNLRTGVTVKWYKLPPAWPTDAQGILTTLRAGVDKRLEADAPVCCLISGGLDSGLVLALARDRTKDVQAYTAVYDNQSPDLIAARRLCDEFGVPLTEVVIELTDESISNAVQSIEIASKAQIEIAILCLPLAKKIRSDGFKACLSGEAADELFGGYGNFCIQASSATDAGVIELRKQQLAKMSRGNFVRCNKAFMAGGVECRLPFMEQALVESTVQMGKQSSPLGKKLLKSAAAGVVPSWVVKRAKDTFQGGSGISAAISKRIHSPTRWYNAELKRRFNYRPVD